MSRALLIRKENLVCEEIEDDLLIVDFRGSQLHVLNPAAAAIWELCNGEHTKEEIVEFLAGHFQISPSDVEPSVATVLTEFREKGLLE